MPQCLCIVINLLAFHMRLRFASLARTGRIVGLPMIIYACTKRNSAHEPQGLLELRRSERFNPLPLQTPCIPRTATARYMSGREPANHRSCLRVRSVSAHGRQYYHVKQKIIWHVCAALWPEVQKKQASFSAVRLALLCRHATVFVSMNISSGFPCALTLASLARAGRRAGLSVIFGACKAQQRSRTAGAAGTAKTYPLTFQTPCIP